MPTWVSVILSGAQVLLVGEAIVAITILATHGSLDGAAAVAAILGSLGVGGGSTAVAHGVAARSIDQTHS